MARQVWLALLQYIDLSYTDHKPQTREYLDWRWPLSRGRSAMVVFSAQLAEGGMHAHPPPPPFHFIYPLHSSCMALSTFSPAKLAEFIDPWLGDKVIELSYRHSRLHGWRVGTTTLCRSWLYPPVRDLWIQLLLFSHIAPLSFSLSIIDMLFSEMGSDQRWAAILKNVSFKAIQIRNFWEKNRIKRYNFFSQNFCYRWSDTNI